MWGLQFNDTAELADRPFKEQDVRVVGFRTADLT
jgi:hypothetical protein